MSATGEIIRTGRVTRGRFALLEDEGLQQGTLDVTLVLGDATAEVSRIRVDLIALARNDPSALLFPPDVTDAIDAERRWELIWFLLPHLRLLTRARVVPREEILRFPA